MIAETDTLVSGSSRRVSQEEARFAPLPAKKRVRRSYLKRYWTLYLLLLLPLAYFSIFKYIPMTYIQIAFKKYSIVKNVWEMPWANNNGFNTS